MSVHAPTDGAATPVVAILPVRGGSVGIPRKNARLLRGKPLLAYGIEAALASREVSAVVVSTDDAELAEIARRFGAQVIDRPAHLAGPEVTLDEVIWTRSAASSRRAGASSTW